MHATNENEILARVDAFISQLPVRNAGGDSLNRRAHSSEQPPESLVHRNHGKTNANPAGRVSAPNPRSAMRLQPADQYLAEPAPPRGGGFHAPVVHFNHRPAVVQSYLRSARLKAGSFFPKGAVKLVPSVAEGTPP